MCLVGWRPDGTLMTMTDNDNRPDWDVGPGPAGMDPGRLARYEASTRQPLDLLALATLCSVVLPPVRVIFSLRLVRSMFRRGHLSRFLVAAAVLVLNGAVIVYLFERHAPGANIRTLGDALWWSFVTVTTVGYGDFYPITTGGRITACFIMGTGVLTLAVITAQVASSFVGQDSSQARPAPQDEPAGHEVTMAKLDQRLARIERLLTAPHPGTSPGAIDGD